MSNGTRMTTPRRRVWGVVTLLLLADGALLGFVATHREINADEGFYLAAGARVAEGAWPYADFFFPQMPVLPMLEAGVFALFGEGLVSGRLVSVGAACLTFVAVLLFVARRKRSMGVVLLFGLLWLGNAVFLSNLTIVKTYAVSNLALVLALLPLLGGGGSAGRFFGSGIAFALAVGARLPTAAALPVLAVLAWRRGSAAFLGLTAGGLLGSVPWLVVAARSPEHFWFNNVRFHLLRDPLESWSGVLLQKGEVLAKWLLMPQHLMVWGLALAGLLLAPRRAGPPAAVAVLLGGVYLAATPTYVDYLTQLMPFLLLAGLPALARLAERRVLASAVLAVYVLGLLLVLRPPPPGSERERKDRIWSMETVNEVTRVLREKTAPGDPVLSWWEGYPFLAERPGFPGVGFWQSHVAHELEPRSARRYHVRRHEEVRDLIEQRQPAAIVVADGAWTDLRERMAEAGYEPARRVDPITIYLRREAGRSEHIVRSRRLGERMRRRSLGGAACNQNRSFARSVHRERNGARRFCAFAGRSVGREQHGKAPGHGRA